MNGPAPEYLADLPTASSAGSAGELLLETRLDAPADAEPAEIAELAARQESEGWSGTFTRETAQDPFLPLAVAATSTSRIELGTAIAVAFARSPMELAYTTHQLQALTGGRFVLGLGTQVRAHITRRYSMGWDAPVARMREYLEALRAIRHSWRAGTPLDHRGRFYTHTLMPTQFRPAMHPYPDPPILLAAVGPAMTRLAAQSADGLITHPFASADYLREVTLPGLRAELRDRGRAEDGFRIAGSALVATGDDETELAAAIERLRERTAFYGSTPAYRPVLEHHGWGDLGERLHALSRESAPDRWARMTRLVPDEAVRTLGVVAPRPELATVLITRYRGVLQRLCPQVHGPAR